MTIAQLLEKMIAYSKGNLHDIDHLLRVWAYAKLIGAQEGLGREEQFILEAAAITHDIACPLCREKYGSTEGRLQEMEGAILTREFLQGSGIPEAQIGRIAFLVGHHHTYTGIDGTDWQILIEADYIANASENGWGREQTESFLKQHARTASGKRLIRGIFGL